MMTKIIIFHQIILHITLLPLATALLYKNIKTLYICIIYIQRVICNSDTERNITILLIPCGYICGKLLYKIEFTCWKGIELNGKEIYNSIGFGITESIAFFFFFYSKVNE